MARPPIEWPIPVYVTELRERVVATFRLPARLFAGHAPAPLAGEIVSGYSFISLALSNGRCVKSTGSGLSLASEFRVAELFTPVRWRGACRPALRGNYLLRCWADRPGLRRLLRSNLQFTATPAQPIIHAERDRLTCSLLAGPSAPLLARWSVRKPAADDAWPAGSILETQEMADVLTVHPECYFVPEGSGRAVNAVPVHQYARATTPASCLELDVTGLAQLLEVPVDALELDHVLYQKRCTHTWSFPPERIPLARMVDARLPSAHLARLAA